MLFCEFTHSKLQNIVSYAFGASSGVLSSLLVFLPGGSLAAPEPPLVFSGTRLLVPRPPRPPGTTWWTSPDILLGLDLLKLEVLEVLKLTELTGARDIFLKTKTS